MRFSSRKFVTLAAIAMGVVVAQSAPAHAGVVCDLRTNSTCPAINGGLFFTDEQHPTGTGFIDSFLRVQQKGFEQGYNTSARPVQFDEKTDPNFTRDLTLAEVGKKVIGGTTYREFFLDVNEPAAQNGKNFITLDQLEIFVSNTASLNSYNNAGTHNTGATGSLAGATKIYDLDNGGANGDNMVQIDYLVKGNGSGSSDIAFYLADSLFGNYKYVYLYSQFGKIDNNNAKWASQAGFEEWFTKSPIPPPNIPEPTVMLLVGSGIAAAWRHRRRKA